MKARKPPLSLVAALTWIVGSTFLISGTTYTTLKYVQKQKSSKGFDPHYRIVSIVQTGPQREALKTVYLAELMGISIDRPIPSFSFNCELAKKRLLQSPVIKEAEVKISSPSSLYVDYTARQPLAWLYDYVNAAVDEEGYLFPVSPFFSPKKLPEIYLGISSETLKWNTQLKNKEIALAISLLKLLSEPLYRDLFSLRRIDVSNAYAESYGIREVVILTEDQIVMHQNEKEVHFVIPRFLRLSTKNYTQELGNYLKLREQMLEEERAELLFPADETTLVRLPEKTIDFRIPQLAFVKKKG